jgi:3-oxoacyl-(acyl-carrier-protein) synthase
LTTTKDKKFRIGVKPWAEKVKSPHINSLKSMVGHCLSGAGSIESVATVLQLYHGFISNTNCNDLNPEIFKTDASQIPQQVLEKKFKSQPKPVLVLRCKWLRYF